MVITGNFKYALLLACLLLIVLSNGAIREIVGKALEEKADPIEEKKAAWAELLACHPYNNRPFRTEADWKKIPRQDRPDLAMEQDYLMTMDPALGLVPKERLIAANERVKRLLELRAPIAGVSWEERGPDNVGGRTRALIFDPNDATNKKVWAGGVSGGLWYTTDITDANAAWVHVDDFWDNIAINCMAYNPANTQEFYVGTGEGWFNADAQQGGGIWKSTDGGSSWARLASTAVGSTYPSNSNFLYVNKIVVKNDGTVFAATKGYYANTGGIMRSTDGGLSWTKVLGPYPTTLDWAGDIEIAANGDLYATIGVGPGDNGKVYKSLHADNGASGTWTDLTPAINGMGTSSPIRIELACAPSDANTIYAVAEGGSGDNDIEWLRRSIDGGSTWSNLAIPRLVEDGTTHFTRGQAGYDLILAVHPTNPNVVIAGGIDLHRTTNGGASWSGISHWYGGFGQPDVHADQHAIQFRPGASNEAIFGNDGGVYYSNNVGNTAATPTFASRNTGYNVTQFYTCAAENEVNSQYFLAGAQDNGTQQFTIPQVGNTKRVVGGDGAYCHVDQLNPTIQTAQYIYNNIYRSTNGGATFPSLISESSGLFINPSEYDSQRKIFYSASDNDKLKRISGMDGTITNVDLSISVGGAKASSLKVSPYNDLLFLGINNGRIYKFTNASAGSPTLFRIDNGTTPITTAGWPSSIDVGANDNHIMVTFSNYGVASVWETTDGGANWYSKEGDLPDIPVRWALYNPENRNQVLLATEMGVWSTDNFGTGTASAPAWGPSNANLAHTRTTMLKYRPADKMVVVSTHGRGLFTTDIFVTTSIADFVFASDESISCTGSLAVNFIDASLKPEGSWAWDVDNDGITDYTTQNPSHTFSSPGYYSVRLTVNNGAAQIVKNVLVQSSEPTVSTGCALSSNSNLGNIFGIGIYRFALGDIDHTSSHNDGYYHNFVCSQWTSLELGASYNVAIRTGTANNEGARVYIDYNDNGTFESGESVVSFPANKDGGRTLSFTTPTSGVTLGKGLRMRVLSKFGAIPGTACDIGTYGQAEDYTVYFANSKYLEIYGLRLQGAMPASGTTMRTDINGLIPTADPYGLSISTSSVPANAVDWVRIELRSGAGPGSATTVVASTAAFLSSNGTVKAVNGDKVDFSSVPNGNYFVAIKHRNHLGVITNGTVAVTAGTLSLIDMSSVALWTNGAVTSNTPATTVNGVRALWGGDANGNGKVTYNGGTNDREAILAQLGFNIVNEDLTYQSEDVNLNGKTSYNGGTNDRESILLILGFSIIDERVAHLP
ncbi:MAG: PKD domain-containing protein [Lewinellaceae bacterium]|nr:PKD domain-containing protein [Lewinellaceae bacterium]